MSELETVALALCKHQQTTVEALRPVTIGPTGTGKTTMWKGIAEEMGLPFLRLLFSQQLPEDIGGWPQPGKDRLKFLLMDELEQARKEPCLILLDELDKVRPDVMATLLTLLYEKAIRNYKLHPKTVLAGAMQPVNPSMWLADETGKAISARLTFLPVPYRWGYIEEKFSLSVPHLHEREKKRKIELPVMEATPRTMECTLSFLRSTHGMQLSKVEKQMVLYGTMAKQDAEIVEAALNQASAWVDPVAAAKIDPFATIESLDVHSLTQHIGPLVEVITPESWTKLVTKVWLEGSEEDSKTALQNLFDYLKGKCEADPNQQCKVFGDAEPDAVVKATNEAAEQIAKVWQGSTKEGKKK